MARHSPVPYCLAYNSPDRTAMPSRTLPCAFLSPHSRILPDQLNMELPSWIFLASQQAFKKITGAFIDRINGFSCGLLRGFTTLATSQ